MRLRFALAVPLAALALAGCGEGDATPEEATREFVEAFDRADERACGELVTDRYVEAVSRGELKGDDARQACLAQLRALEASSIRIELMPSVDVQGDRAEIEVRLQIGEDRRRQRITLKRVDGDWLVDEVQPL